MMLSESGRLLCQNAWLLNLAKLVGRFWSQEHCQEATGYEALTA